MAKDSVERLARFNSKSRTLAGDGTATNHPQQLGHTPKIDQKVSKVEQSGLPSEDEDDWSEIHSAKELEREVVPISMYENRISKAKALITGLHGAVNESVIQTIILEFERLIETNKQQSSYIDYITDILSTIQLPSRVTGTFVCSRLVANGTLFAIVPFKLTRDKMMMDNWEYQTMKRKGGIRVL